MKDREALVEAQESTNRLQRTTILLTWALMVFAVMTVAPDGGADPGQIECDQ